LRLNEDLLGDVVGSGAEAETATVATLSNVVFEAPCAKQVAHLSTDKLGKWTQEHFYSHTMNNSSGSSLQLLFDAALQNYEKQTGLKLVDHPLSIRLENCHSADLVIDILQQQGRNLRNFRGADGKITRFLRRVVRVLHALSTSTTLGEGIGLVRRMVF